MGGPHVLCRPLIDELKVATSIRRAIVERQANELTKLAALSASTNYDNLGSSGDEQPQVKSSYHQDSFKEKLEQILTEQIRSMAVLPTNEGQAISAGSSDLNPNILQVLLYQASADGTSYQASEQLNSLKEMRAINVGVLNKKKLSKAGWLSRKNWTPRVIVLSEDNLKLFKVSKALTSNTIDLADAQIEWSSDKSSRKVFRVAPVSGHEILLQHTDSLVAEEWYDAIKSAILKLPSKLEQAEDQNITSESADNSLELTLDTPSSITIEKELAKRVIEQLIEFQLKSRINDSQDMN